MRWIPAQSFTLPHILTVSAVAAVALLSGCGGDGGGAPKPNQTPFVSITGGPPEGLRDSYTARIWWTGWDFDGYIDHYQYLIDPSPVFTEAEVAAPEQFLTTADPPGELQLLVLRGPADRTDTLRFSKVVDGQTWRMDWVQSPDFSRSFAFQTPVADSTQDGSTKIPTDEFSGLHTIIVRARDNEGGYSGVDYLGYTAVTKTPTSSITRPRATQNVLNVGTQITFNWDGTDSDSPDPRRKPVGYIYKLVALSALVPPVRVDTADPHFVMYVRAAGIPWTYQSAETTSAGFFLEPRTTYMFATRAVDIAGAVEPLIVKLRGNGDPGNYIKFQSLAQAGVPKLTVTEPSLGSHTFSGLDQPVEYEVPVGTRLRFTWVGNADEYGGTIEGYNWGVDIADLDREGPGSGWTGWSTITRNLEPIVFKKPGTHTLYVRVRDTGNISTLATIILKIIDFPFDREILIVDDYKDTTFPRDIQHDAFWNRIVAGSGRYEPADLDPLILYFDAFGDSDLYIPPQGPPLELLGRYAFIVVDSDGGTGYDGYSALTISAAIRRHLGAYLSAGGTLWITGRSTVAAMVPGQTGRADYNYPKEMAPNTFPWDFLKMYSGEVRNDKDSDNRVNGLFAVEPFPGKPEVLPRMEIDQSKLSATLRNKYGVGGCDILYEPIFEGADPDFTGSIDSLYVMRSTGPQFNNRASSYDKRFIGYRWSDPDPARPHGRIMWFGFPVYWFFDAHFQETFNRAVDWFREEQPASKSS